MGARRPKDYRPRLEPLRNMSNRSAIQTRMRSQRPECPLSLQEVITALTSARVALELRKMAGVGFLVLSAPPAGNPPRAKRKEG